MRVDTTNKEYDKYLPRWQQVDDVCDGENVDQYIIEINPHDSSAENQARNKQFKERAVFAEIAGYTARGMVGIIYRKWPKIDVPTLLEYVKNNIDGAGSSIYQQSQAVAKSCVRKGRAGLWVDFPNAEEGASVADMQAGRIMATAQRFEPHQIIDWDTESDGAHIKLSLVKLKDSETARNEHGEQEIIPVIIELSLEDGVYVYRKYQELRAGWELVEEFAPTDSAGQPWNEIPFMFVGSETNTPSVDHPPMTGIVRINIGHLNNSASYEDSVFMCGQPQPWASGLQVDQVQEMQAAGMYWGSNVMIPVPNGESVGIVQAAPNTLAKEAMQDKLDLAVGQGALFIQPGTAVKTATQAEGEQEVQHSVLSLIASNVSEAYTQCLVWMGRFMGTSDAVEYTLSQDFVNPRATPQELQTVVATLMQGAMPWSDYVRWTQKHGYVDPEKTPEQVAEEVGRGTVMPDLSGGDAE